MLGLRSSRRENPRTVLECLVILSFTFSQPIDEVFANRNCVRTFDSALGLRKVPDALVKIKILPLALGNLGPAATSEKYANPIISLHGIRQRFDFGKPIPEVFGCQARVSHTVLVPVDV